MKPILVEIAAGELLDKITILQIKRVHITQPDKVLNIENELAALEAARATAMPASQQLDRLVAELRDINEALWVIEDDIRLCEKSGDFGPVRGVGTVGVSPK